MKKHPENFLYDILNNLSQISKNFHSFYASILNKFFFAI